jgi:hypothetical protein
MDLQIFGRQDERQMRLSTELLLAQCWVKKIQIEITEEDPKITITLRTAATREVCESFGCRELIWAGDVPRSGVEKLVLAGEQSDVDFHLKNDNLGYFAVANSIEKFVAKMEATGPKLEFQVKITGYADLVVDLMTKVKVDPVEVTLKPAQLDLKLQPEQPKTDAKEDGPCIQCNNEIPFAAFEKDGVTSTDYSLHVTGQPCVNYRKPEEDKAAPLAQAAVMGGTHQGKRKKN